MKSWILSSFSLLMLAACTTTKTISETPLANDATMQNAVARWIGELPCADCEAIDYRLTLRADQRFEEISVYRGKDQDEFHESGEWLMNADNIIILKQADRVHKYFAYNNDQLEMLDISGEKIESAMQDKYMLQRDTLPDLGSLARNKWMLVELNGEMLPSTDTSQVPFMEFDFSSSRIMGVGGCNRYNATFAMEGTTLNLQPIVSTKMACDNLETETKFFEMLAQPNIAVSLSGNELILTGEKGHMVFNKQVQ